MNDPAGIAVTANSGQKDAGTGNLPETSSQEALVEEMIQVEGNTTKLHFLMKSVEIVKQIQRSQNLAELLRQTMILVLNSYHLHCVAIFLPDPISHEISLEQYYSSDDTKIEGLPKEKTNALSSVGWTAKYRQSLVIPNVRSAPGAPYILPETKAEACLPIFAGEKLVGILESQSTMEGAFTTEIIDSLQVICDFLGPSIEHHNNHRSINEMLGDLSFLYQASQGLSTSQTREQIFRNCAKSLRQFSYPVYLFSREGSSLYNASSGDKSLDNQYIDLLQLISEFPIEALVESLAFQEYLHFTKEHSPLELPTQIHTSLQALEWNSFTVVPIGNHAWLEGLFVLLSNGEIADQRGLQLCQSLASMASNALERIERLTTLERQVSHSQILDTASREIRIEIEPENLYQVIHNQVARLVGDTDFLIALYRSETSIIEIPYAFENHRRVSIASFPLGDGPTSRLILARKPFMLTEPTEELMRLFETETDNMLARSWLGIPLLLDDDVIGALIIKDQENEGQFDADDQLMLTMLASQIAISIRNALLFVDTKNKVEQKSMAADITNELWHSSSIEMVLRTALNELGKSLNASHGLISLDMPSEEAAANVTEVYS